MRANNRSPKIIITYTDIDQIKVNNTRLTVDCAIKNEVMAKQSKGSNATGLCQRDTCIATGVVQLICAKGTQECGTGAMQTGLCQRDTSMWDGAKQ